MGGTSVPHWWKSNRLVSSSMRWTSAHAAPPPTNPSSAANPASRASRFEGVRTIIVRR